MRLFAALLLMNCADFMAVPPFGKRGRVTIV
jgi:hypothetical protein